MSYIAWGVKRIMSESEDDTTSNKQLHDYKSDFSKKDLYEIMYHAKAIVDIINKLQGEESID